MLNALYSCTFLLMGFLGLRSEWHEKNGVPRLRLEWHEKNGGSSTAIENNTERVEEKPKATDRLGFPQKKQHKFVLFFYAISVLFKTTSSISPSRRIGWSSFSSCFAISFSKASASLISAWNTSGFSPFAIFAESSIP